MNKLNELKRIEEDEKKIEDKIHKSDIYQELEKLKEKKKNLLREIKELSLFDAEEVSKAISKVMSTYENTNYSYSKGDYEYEFSADKHDKNYYQIRYRLKLCEEIIPSQNKKVSLTPIEEEKCGTYVDKFTNYLCNARYNGNTDNVMILADNFLEETKEEQQERHKDIKRQKVETKINELRHQFEKNCKVDRKTIFSILTYIISKYDTDFDVNQRVYVEKIIDDVYCCHQLIIKNDTDENTFSTVIDSDYIDYYNNQRYHLNYNLDTEIGFYDLKENLPLIENTTYAKNFMNMIEDKFERGEAVNKNDCYNFLIEVSNQKKAKQKSKRKDS